MHSVKRNIVWNLLGNVLPLMAGLILFPLIIEAYGLERFGLLTLAWALVGYFGLFDLGLSRALTQQVSSLLAAKQDTRDIAELIRTALRLMLVMGGLGGLVLWISTPFIVSSILHISNTLMHEAISAFSILAISIPFVVHTSALRGVLESLQMFKSASLIRMVMGIGTFLGPYLASIYSNSLVDAIYALIFVRLIVWALHYFCVYHTEILKPVTSGFNSKWLGPLFKFGSWLTLSNLIGPLMVYLDRFVIVSMLGVASVAYYVAPYEVITRLWVVPVAITGVLFPLFAQHFHAQPAYAINMLERGVRYVLLLLFPVCLILVFFSHEWLGLWLGHNFALESADVVTWLLAGILINSAAQVVYAKVQGAGRSDLTAKLHLLELLPYLLILWILLNLYGIAGAAMAWCARVAIDFFGLIYIMLGLHPKQKHQLMQLAVLTLIATSAILLLGSIDLLLFKWTAFVSTVFLYTWFAIKQIHQDGMLCIIQNYLKLFKND
jgi:O-antigen/teichoic acid export membrane protein